MKLLLEIAISCCLGMYFFKSVTKVQKYVIFNTVGDEGICQKTF